MLLQASASRLKRRVTGTLLDDKALCLHSHTCYVPEHVGRVVWKETCAARFTRRPQRTAQAGSGGGGTQVIPREASQISVETAGRSVATFEGEQFFTPDDIPDGLDLATSASMQRDQQASPRSRGSLRGAIRRATA